MYNIGKIQNKSQSMNINNPSLFTLNQFLGSSVNQLKNDSYDKNNNYDEYLEIDESGQVIKAVVKPKDKAEFSPRQWRVMYDTFLEKTEFASKLVIQVQQKGSRKKNKVFTEYERTLIDFQLLSITK